MRVEYDSLVDELSRVLSTCRLAAHRARVKALSTLLQGLLVVGEASLSGMGRGAALADEQKTFQGQLKRAFRLLNNPQVDPWEVGKALFDRLTERRQAVLIAVDGTHLGEFMLLEASLVVEGRGIPLFSLSVPKAEIKGRQRTLELSRDYALAAMRRPGQTLYTVVDRGFAALDYVGPSECYPWLRRVTRLTATMLLHWDSVSAPLKAWPLYEGEVVEIPEARLGRKKQVVCGVVLAPLGAACYLACHGDDVSTVLNFYQKRVWIEEQNRDIKTAFRGRAMRFLRAIRFERMWGLLGLAFSMAYSHAQQALHQQQRLSRRYKEGRKELSWLSLSRYVHHVMPCRATLAPLLAQ
jgi:hypothetical protein